MTAFKEGFADKLEVPAGATDIQVFDSELPGFGCRKFASGAASYFVKYIVGTQQRRKTLGRVLKGNLKAMRLEASAILAKARLGVDVVAEAKAAGKPIVEFRHVIPLYLASKEPELREKSHTEIERYLTKTWKPLHTLDVAAISRKDIVAVLDTIEHKVAADRARTALSGLYAWLIDRSYVESTPVLNIRSRAQGGGRTRVLSEVELVRVWPACGDDDFGAIIKLLLLTGQRKTEISALTWFGERPVKKNGKIERDENGKVKVETWCEIDLDRRQIDLPEHRTKNHRPHIIPLSEQALEIIKAVPRGSGYLFGRSGDGFQGWTPPKLALDKRANVHGWVIHDLRRTFVTHVGDLGFAQPHVIEAIVNHVTGAAKSGTAGVYNKSLYLNERRQALDVWGNHIAALVAGGTGKVVPLRRVAP